jgi:hypothetical protein
MLRVLEPFLRKWDSRRYQRNVKRALALHLRGEVRRDGLTPIGVTTHVDIQWHARDIHPWDHDLLSQTQRALAYVQQSLSDTEAAICRLFEALPQVDVVTVKVLDRTEERVIISGSVSRLDFAARDEHFAIGMRLLYLGLSYHSSGDLFEPIEESTPLTPTAASAFGAIREEETLVMYRRKL